MSPSRGLLRPTHTFSALLTSPISTQIYLSLSQSPHLNLALENYLFTSLPETTRTLLVYINTPALILGRNQNPWVETHHSLVLRTPGVHLLRRFSGGGTVFHDQGNVNYSVTVPTAEFNRDTHAKLMVRVLRQLGVAGAAVNARHDIVIDTEVEGSRKVSGSAYKLTRLRSYHHGTMLLSTDLDRVKELLKCPAKDVITARGVASVPSPVTNTGVDAKEFVSAAVEEFATLYGNAGIAVVGEQEAMEKELVMKAVRKMESQEWVYGQTPKFTMRLPVGEVVADKGVVEEVNGVDGTGIVGQRFGGEVVETLLVRGGMEKEEAKRWADEMVGGRAWGTVADTVADTGADTGVVTVADTVADVDM
ncbi:hypothetical protein BZA05DRAFT_331933 [Tricharina praecox]|uniref:uncharacterized protein n=1 Tax=Tricharina praecox TaxID=43433 RepID=UPI00221EBFE4|nr:uncharacterized protein BZA05DRAFT_331933 [Tricharina praecox]KAI5857248.1 hypothetical protein BZA05DRAFT_331933 [Tricharina praecox]